MKNLIELKQGQKGFVAELNTNDEDILKKLISIADWQIGDI